MKLAICGECLSKIFNDLLMGHSDITQKTLMNSYLTFKDAIGASRVHFADLFILRLPVRHSTRATDNRICF